MARPAKKIILINRDFQLRYTWASVLVGLTSTVLTGVVILYPLYVFEILRIPRFLPVPILGAMGVAALVNIGFVAFMGLILTHRIAGPMYSIVRQLRRLEAGLWHGHMRLRPGDELGLIVRHVNDLTDALGQDCRADIGALDRLVEALEGSAQAASAEMAETLAAARALRVRMAARIGAVGDEAAQQGDLP